MLLPYVLLLLPLLVTAEKLQSTDMRERANWRMDGSKSAFRWMTDGLLHIVDAFLPVTKSCDTVEARRKKKHKLNKYLLPMILGFLLIKSILLPIALKALAVLSGKAVVLSFMSLVLAAIVGLKKVAQSPGSNYEVVNLSSKYRRQDMADYVEDTEQNEPYKYYKERRRK